MNKLDIDERQAFHRIIAGIITPAEFRNTR